jgi:hypothetical protein
MLAHFPSIKCAFRPRRICRLLPAGGVCPIVSLTAAISDIAAVSPTATNDKVERLGAESARRTAATHANGPARPMLQRKRMSALGEIAEVGVLARNVEDDPIASLCDMRRLTPGRKPLTRTQAQRLIEPDS